MLPVREDREQIRCRVGIDADGEEIIDDQKVNLGQLVEELLVFDAVVSRDHEPAREVVKCRVW